MRLYDPTRNSRVGWWLRLSVASRSVSAIALFTSMMASGVSNAQDVERFTDDIGRPLGDVRYLPMEEVLGFNKKPVQKEEVPPADPLPIDNPLVVAPPLEVKTERAPVSEPEKSIAETDGVFHGTEGNDTFDVGDLQSPFIHDPGGYDTILSTSSRDLEDYPDIEHLTLLGGGDIDGFGNVKANRLIGNAGNNVLVGRGGADFLAGGEGDDTYVLEAATNDTIEDSGGIDTITSTITRDLADYPGIENLELTFSAHVDGFGDDGPNYLRGNAGNNKLDGRAGDDVLDGGKGADTLTGGPGRDRFMLSAIGDSKTAAGHRDIITDFKSGEDVIDLSQIAPATGLVFIGEAEFSGVAGQVRWYKKNKDWIILAIDINGDATADAEIEIAPVRQIKDQDLVL